MASHVTRNSRFAFSRLQIVAAMAAALGVALVFQDTFAYLFENWQRDEYSHGFLIPIVSAFLLWQRWPEIRQMQFRSTWKGAPLVAAGLSIWFLASQRDSGSVETYGLVTVIAGCLLTLMGGKAFRLAIAPVLLLLLMSPLPAFLYDVLATALSTASAQVGVIVMRIFGTSVLLQGTLIDLGAFSMNVAGDYSALNSLFPLLTLAVLIAVVTTTRAWVRWVVALSAIPVVMTMNGLRVGIVGLAVDRFGVAALGAAPLVEGWVMFMSCVLVLVAEVWLLLKISGDPRRLREALAIEWPAPARAAEADEASQPRNAGARLLIVTSNFAPELTGIGKYVGEMSEWLAQAGFDIRVITAPPYYPAWRVAPGYSSRRYSRERLAGAVVYRCPLLVPRRPRGATRLLHMLSFSLSTLPVVVWQAVAWRPRMVFVVEPPLGCAPGAWLAAKLSGAQAWLHVQDFEVDAAFDLGLLRGEQLRRLALGLERWLMRRFDRVSSISPRMQDKLLRKGVDPQRLGYFPNWVDTTLIKPVSRDNALRDELGIPGDVAVFLYSGNMGEKQGLEVLVEVARLFTASRSPALFLLCGEGAVKSRTIAAAAGLRNMRFLPLQPLDRLNELLGLADVHLLPQRMDAEDLVMPSKLTAIMASGRPVIAGARPGSDVARAAGAGGLVVPPGDAVAFAAALQLLLDDAALRATLGRSGRAFAVANWDREIVLRNARDDLEAALGEVAWNKTDTSYG